MRSVEPSIDIQGSTDLSVSFAHVSPFYCDYNASSPISESLTREASAAFREHWMNPSAAYFAAKKELESTAQLRSKFRRFIPTSSPEVVFCSSATEAINQAIHSLSRNLPIDSELFISDIEHAAVRNASRKWFGDRVIELSARKLAERDFSQIEGNLDRIQRGAVFIQAANNETGIILPVAEIRHAIGRAKLLLDGSQSFGKDDGFVEALSEADSVVVSPHKFYGPKGMGILVWSENLGAVHPLVVGGGQERDLRAGTENVPGVFLTRAWLSDTPKLLSAFSPVRDFRDKFESVLTTELKSVRIVGESLARLPNTSAFYVGNLLADSIVAALDADGIMASSGSACHSGTPEPSRSYLRLGLTWEEARSVVRFSFGIANLRINPVELAKVVVKRIRRLQGM